MCLHVKGVVGEETGLAFHRQEVEKVQQLQDIKVLKNFKETSQETKASKVNDPQEAEKLDPPCSSDNPINNMLHY